MDIDPATFRVGVEIDHNMIAIFSNDKSNIADGDTEIMLRKSPDHPPPRLKRFRRLLCPIFIILRQMLAYSGRQVQRFPRTFFYPVGASTCSLFRINDVPNAFLRRRRRQKLSALLFEFRSYLFNG